MLSPITVVAQGVTDIVLAAVENEAIYGKPFQDKAEAVLKTHEKGGRYIKIS